MNEWLNKKTFPSRETSIQGDLPAAAPRPAPKRPAGFPESLGLEPRFYFFLDWAPVWESFFPGAL